MPIEKGEHWHLRVLRCLIRDPPGEKKGAVGGAGVPRAGIGQGDQEGLVAMETEARGRARVPPGLAEPGGEVGLGRGQARPDGGSRSPGARLSLAPWKAHLASEGGKAAMGGGPGPTGGRCYAGYLATAGRRAMKGDPQRTVSGEGHPRIAPMTVGG